LGKADIARPDDWNQLKNKKQQKKWTYEKIGYSMLSQCFEHMPSHFSTRSLESPAGNPCWTEQYT
jgi:hypothetical protein